MKKIAAKAVVAVLCALALTAPAAGGYPEQPGGPSQPGGPAAATAAGPAAPLTHVASQATSDDNGTAAAANSPGEPLADAANAAAGTEAALAAPEPGPSPRPFATAAAPAAATQPVTATHPATSSQPDTSPEVAGTGTPARDASGAAAAGPPEPASIPPLSAPDDAFVSPREPAQTEGTQPEPGSAPRALTPEALVPDSNAAQVGAVFNAINTYRASLGLPAVMYHATVAGMAQEWSDSIASREVIEHRAGFWTDARALSPDNGAGEVIAVRWDRDAAQLVEWWKGSPAHHAILTDPRFNVVGIGITFTDGNWQTNPGRYTMWGVVNFFGYSGLPSGTASSPGGSTAVPVQPADVCEPLVKHMPPTLDLATAAIRSAGDLLSVDAAGQLINRPSIGNGLFGPAEVAGSGFAAAQAVFVTDWERDGIFDVLAQWPDGRLTLHSGALAGGFLAPVTLGQSGWTGLTLAVGGWCSANRLPQLLVLDSGANLWLYPNRGTGDLVERTLIASGVAATRLAMVDFDGDGFQDLLARQGDGNVLLYRGSGTPWPRVEARAAVASGWGDVSAIRSLKDVTGAYSAGLALQRPGNSVQYLGLFGGALSAPSAVPGSWTGQRLAQ